MDLDRPINRKSLINLFHLEITIRVFNSFPNIFEMYLNLVSRLHVREVLIELGLILFLFPTVFMSYT